MYFFLLLLQCVGMSAELDTGGKRPAHTALFGVKGPDGASVTGLSARSTSDVQENTNGEKHKERRRQRCSTWTTGERGQGSL